MSDDLTTPFGMWRYGNDFRQAAVAVLDHHSDRAFMPYYFLVGQSVELLLKAFLLGRSMHLNVLRSKKYGHNLKALLDEARSQQLEAEVKLTGTDCAVIHLLGIEYLEKRFQYIRTGRMYLPEQPLAQRAVDKLSTGLEPFCKKATGYI
jgi:HEPN domain-containing protein